MALRFDTMLYSYLGNENSDVGHIKCSRGPQVPQPVLTHFAIVWKEFFVSCFSKEFFKSLKIRTLFSKHRG